MGNNNTSRSFVYAIQASTTQFIKIGTSVDVEKRLRDLQGSCPEDLEVIGCWFGGRDLESIIHSRLDDYRKHREWFAPADEVTRLIQQYNQAVPGSIPGRLKIAVGSGEWVEFWTSCKAAQEAKKLPICENVLFCDFCGKDQHSVVKLIASSQASICNECVMFCTGILAETTGNDNTEGQQAASPVANEPRYVFTVGSIGEWYYSARSKEEALIMWLSDQDIDRSLSGRIKIEEMDDALPMTIAYDTGQEITRTFQEWAASHSGRLGYLLDRADKPVQFSEERELIASTQEAIAITKAYYLRRLNRAICAGIIGMVIFLLLGIFAALNR